jgi:adenosine kinase
MSVLTTGYPSIDRIARVSRSPAGDETARLLTVPGPYTFGGCGANIAVGLARLGLGAGTAMVLGDDSYGADYLRHLTGCGVNTDNCLRLAGEQTSQAYLFMNPEGQNQLFFFAGAADAWQGDAPLRNLAGYRFAVVTVGQLTYNQQFIRQVAAHDIPLVWVMKADVVAYPPETIALFLAYSRCVIMNHTEADYVRRARGVGDLTQLLSTTTQTLVVTHGAADIEIITSSGTQHVKTVPPSAIVDPTGAGDGFAAGFLAGLLHDTPIQVCAQLGSVIAAFVIEAVGCQTNLPTWPQAMQRYTAHYGEFEGRL